MAGDPTLQFFYELGQLARVRHEGFGLALVDPAPSVAGHNLRVAQIAFVLARLEKYSNPFEVCTLAVFHEIGETRVGDLHRVAHRYVEIDEERAVREQTEPLGEIGAELLKFWREVDERSSVAGVIAKDADELEQALAAKELIERGYSAAEDWIHNVGRILRTDSARKLHSEILNSKSTDWWKGLKKLSTPAGQ